MRALMPFALAGLVVAGPVWAQADRDYLTAFLEDNLSGAGRTVTVTGFEGALSSQATMDQLTIADDQGIWLTLNHVVLDWNRAALLGGVVSVNALTAEEIVLDRMPVRDPATPSPEASAFALPELPVSVNIGKIEAGRIALGPMVLGEAVVGKVLASAVLVGGTGALNIALERTDGAVGHLDLAASYVGDSGQLSVLVDAEEAAGGVAVHLLGVPGAPAAHLRVAGSGPVSDFAAQVGLETDGTPRLTGTVTLAGDGKGQTGFAAELSGDLAPLFVPDYAAFFGPKTVLSAAGTRGADGRMALSRLQVRAQAISLDGSLVLAADGLPDAFALKGHLGLPGGVPVLLPLTTAAEMRVAGADLSLSYDRAKGEVWQGEARLTGLDRADFKVGEIGLSASGQIVHGAGAAEVTGGISFAAKGLAPADPALAEALGAELTGTAAISWHEGDGRVRLSDLTLKGRDYTLSLAGKIGGLSEGLRLEGRITADYAAVARLSGLAGRSLSGAASASLTGWVSPLSGQFDLAGSISGHALGLGQPMLDGVLRGDTFFDVSARRDESGTTLRRLHLAARGLEITAQGKIATAGSDVTADLRFDDLSVLGGAYRGGLQGNARLLGDFATGRLTLQAKGSGLAIGQAQVDALLVGESAVQAEGRLVAGQPELNHLAIRGASLVFDAVGRLTLEGSDAALSYRLPDLRALGPRISGAVSGTGRLTGAPQAGHLSLQAEVQGLALGQVEIDRLLGGAGKVEAELALTPQGVGIESAALTTRGLTLKASGTATGALRDLIVDGRVNDLALILPEFPGALTLTGTARHSAAGTELDLQAKGPGQIAARVTGRLGPDFRTADLSIAGTAQAGLVNLLIAPRVASGTVSFDLTLKGKLAPASLSGRVGLRDGRLSDPSRNIALTGITAEATLAGGQAQVRADGKVSGGGTVRVTGSVGLTAPYPGDLSVEIDQAVLRDPQFYTTSVSGAVTVKGPAFGGALVAGRLTLARTELRIPATGFGALGALPEVTHHGDSAEVRATRARAGIGLGPEGRKAPSGVGYRLNLQISAPTQIFIRGRGLDAELGGALTLQGSTNEIIPAGSFSLIRGRLDLLGKRLNLSEATLQLQGALVPFVRIAASTESEGIISSVLIEGDATNPRVSFTSQPPLPEEEVLARLLFDQGLQSLSPFQAAQLASAVATLAGKGGEGVVGRLRKSFGLDNLDVQTDVSGNASVTAGKYLSENLYTEVTVDQQGKSQVNLNFDISPDVTLRGHADSTGTAGLGIFLERDY